MRKKHFFHKNINSSDRKINNKSQNHDRELLWTYQRNTYKCYLIFCAFDMQILNKRIIFFDAFEQVIENRVNRIVIHIQLYISFLMFVSRLSCQIKKMQISRSMARVHNAFSFRCCAIRFYFSIFLGREFSLRLSLMMYIYKQHESKIRKRRTKFFLINSYCCSLNCWRHRTHLVNK